MYASIRETGRIFRGDMQVRGSATHFSRPTPRHADIRELTLVDAPKLSISLGLCRIAVIEFRGCTFHADWCASLPSMRLTPLDGIMLMVSTRRKNVGWQEGGSCCVVTG
jgi:pyruvate-formate lyase-activating enzyme